jgi:selenide,water dikinase
VSVIQKILEGGESVCAEAGIPIAGGHSIDTLEPIYGLVGLGLVHPDKVKKNSTARAGDLLVLGKPLGVGILSAALKKGKLSDAGYRAMLALTTQLNTPGEALADMADVHAVTDVTGFGLAGHLLEMLRGSKLAGEVSFDSLPVIAEALEWVQQGVATGASDRNWNGYGQDVQLAAGAPEWQRKLLSDPQTSGGLLVACAPQAEKAVHAEFAKRGFAEARTIGRLSAGPPYSRGLRAFQTFSSRIGCAASVGWMRSGWNLAKSSPMPSNTNGTSAVRCRLATSANADSNSRV